MFSCYRRDEAHDPDTYCAAVSAVLADGYSQEVVDYITDPRTGLPSTLKFLPSVAEVREGCDERAAHIERLARWEGLKPVPRAEIPVRAGEITFDQFLKRCEAHKLEPRPIGRFEIDGFEKRAREGGDKQKLTELVEAGNQYFYKRGGKHETE